MAVISGRNDMAVMGVVVVVTACPDGPDIGAVAGATSVLGSGPGTPAPTAHAPMVISAAPPSAAENVCSRNCGFIPVRVPERVPAQTQLITSCVYFLP